jgi:hypothetical protein
MVSQITASLSSLPQAAPGLDWFNQPGVGRVLGKVRQDRGKLVAWLGYPVRLRQHRTPRWEGFFVEPVLIWRIELGGEGDDIPRIEDDAPGSQCEVPAYVCNGRRTATG